MNRLDMVWERVTVLPGEVREFFIHIPGWGDPFDRSLNLLLFGVILILSIPMSVMSFYAWIQAQSARTAE
jgi:hypothetical protein